MPSYVGHKRHLAEFYKKPEEEMNPVTDEGTTESRGISNLPGVTQQLELQVY